MLFATQNGAGANLQACATDSAHYFNSTSAAGINAAFTQIARDISNLRLTQQRPIDSRSISSGLTLPACGPHTTSNATHNETEGKFDADGIADGERQDA